MSRRAVPKKKISRDETKQKTRDALVAAATRLFAERGFDAPSLDDICDRAGFTRGAFYVHFRDRDDLVRAVMQRVGRAFLDGLLGAANDDLAGIAHRFVAAMTSGAYPLTKKGGIRPYQLLDACARSPAIRKEYVALVEETIGRLAEATAKAQREKKIRGDLPSKGVGLFLVAAVIGVQTLMDLEVPIDVGESASFALKILKA
jgi:AcrR family transcriptional regulator